MTWEEYKDDVESKDNVAKSIINEAEVKSAIITAIINRRNDLGISQRQLAESCGIPQSSVARIESNKTTPKLDTLIKIFMNLDLEFTVTPLTHSS